MHRSNRAVSISAVGTAALAMLLANCGGLAAQTSEAAPSTTASACRGDNGGLKLSPGFCATVFADNLGHVRQMVVAPNGILYVNTWSGRYFKSPPPPGAFLIALRDTTGDGHADFIERSWLPPTPSRERIRLW